MRFGAEKVLVLAALLFSIVVGTGCAPRYIPPADPFEVSDESYRVDQELLRKAVAEAADTDHVYERKSDPQFKRAIEHLLIRAKEGHVPSQSLGGLLLVSSYEGTLGCLKNMKTRKKMLALLAEAGKSEARAIKDAKVSYRKGVELLTAAAHTGYPEAIFSLEKRKLPVPPVDTKTRSQIQAERDYQLRLADHQKSMEALGKVLALTAVAGLAIVNASSGNSGTYPNSSSSSALYDSSGCCSHHGGIARNLYGQKYCHWSGTLLCNDGSPSRTCPCS
ncbi:MAG: hypothetical protein J0M12_17235 [Deltaproteobacteria bacterium]|nr:hypothetical protein [Deltaproteobacteria bacterium]